MFADQYKQKQIRITNLSSIKSQNQCYWSLCSCKEIQNNDLDLKQSIPIKLLGLEISQLY